MKLTELARRAILLAAIPALATGVAVAQEPEPVTAEASGETRTIHEGVYTEEQADRGFEAFRARGCAGCHGEDFKGTPGGPNLTGFLFMYHWGDMTAADVFDFMQNNMPPGAAGSLTSQAYTDVLATIFRANGFPAGETELDPEGLASILIVPAAE